MSLLLLGTVVLIAICVLAFVGRSSRRDSEPMSRSDLVERMKRLPWRISPSDLQPLHS